MLHREGQGGPSEGGSAPADSPSSTSPADGAAQGGEILTWKHGISPEQLGEPVPEVLLIGLDLAPYLVPGTGVAAPLYLSAGVQRAGSLIRADKAAAALHLPATARGGVGLPCWKGDTEASRLIQGAGYGMSSLIIWSCPFRFGTREVWVHGLELGRGRDFAQAFVSHLRGEVIAINELPGRVTIGLLEQDDRGGARWSTRPGHLLASLGGPACIFDSWRWPDGITER